MRLLTVLGGPLCLVLVPLLVKFIIDKRKPRIQEETGPPYLALSV